MPRSSAPEISLTSPAAAAPAAAPAADYVDASALDLGVLDLPVLAAQQAAVERLLDRDADAAPGLLTAEDRRAFEHLRALLENLFDASQRLAAQAPRTARPATPLARAA